jgi:hypothetical protein
MEARLKLAPVQGFASFAPVKPNLIACSPKCPSRQSQKLSHLHNIVVVAQPVPRLVHDAGKSKLPTAER